MKIPQGMPPEMMLAIVAGMFQAGETDEAAKMLHQLYEEQAEEIRPLIALAKPFMKTLGSDIGLVVSLFVDSINGIGESTALQASTNTMHALRANTRKRILDSYESAGFTRAEAMTLLLQDVANAKAAVQQLQQLPTQTAKKDSRSKPAPEARAT
jgi:hypothetical protein